MATTSFEKVFVVSDKTAIKQLKKDAKNPRRVTLSGRDYKADKEKGIKLLQQRLLRLETC